MGTFTKTYYKPITGRQVVTAADASATFAEVMIRSGVINTAPAGVVLNCNVFASNGTAKTGFKVNFYSFTESGVVKVENGTSSLVADDVINLMATFYAV